MGEKESFAAFEESSGWRAAPIFLRDRTWRAVRTISSHLAAVRTPVFNEVKRIITLDFSEVKRTIHLFLYVDFVLLYDDFDCNIFFGPVIRHEYCNTFANYYVGALLYEI